MKIKVNKFQEKVGGILGGFANTYGMAGAQQSAYGNPTIKRGVEKKGWAGH